MIKPEIGRHVHYVQETNSTNLRGGDVHAAIITDVHDGGLVTLCVFTRDGRTVPRKNVRLQQPEDAVPDGSYCRWMPYTVAQAEQKKAA